MLTNANIMPSFGTSDFGLFAYNFERYEELRQTLGKRQTKRNVRFLQEQLGALSLQQLHRRRELISLRENVYYAWRANFSSVVDIGEAMEDLVASTTEVTPKVPEQSYYPTPYIHFGGHKQLRLTRLDRSIDGVFVRPYRAPSGELRPYESGKGNAANEFADVAVGIQLLACTRPHDAVLINSLEDWTTQLSTFSCTSLVAGKLHFVDGDPEIADDPAIDLANRIALRVFAEHLLALGRSAPPKPEGVIITL